MFIFYFYLFIFEREEARRGAEKNIDVREKHLREKQRSAVSHTHPNWGPDRNLGICSDQGSNPKPSGEQDNTPHQMSHQPGPLWFFYVPWPGIEPATLRCLNDALANEPTLLGLNKLVFGRTSLLLCPAEVPSQRLPLHICLNLWSHGNFQHLGAPKSSSSLSVESLQFPLYSLGHIINQGDEKHRCTDGS